MKQLRGIYQTFTAEQVRDWVKKYAKDERALRYEIIPMPTSAPATAGR